MYQRPRFCPALSVPVWGHPKSIPPEADSNQINRANLEMEQREQYSGVEGLLTRRFFASV